MRVSHPVLLVMAAAFLVGANQRLAAQGSNLGFEARSGVDAERPDGWQFRPAGSGVSLDTIAYEGRLSLRITRDAAGPATVAMQSMPAASLSPPARIRLSGYVRTREVGEGTARLWLVVHGAAQPMLFADDTAGRGVEGTQGWTRYTIEAPLPPEAALIQFGVLLDGVGAAWFDALELAPVAPDAPIADTVRAYLDHALDLMQAYSLRRDSIDWPSFRAGAIASAAGVQRIVDVHPVIEMAVRRLGDGHSLFRRPAAARDVQQTGARPDRAAAGSLPAGAMAGGRIGYVWVPEFGSADSLRAAAYADTLHRIIERLDARGVCGWVLDLRDNTGGNMWPMLAGVGPLLGEGTAGWFVQPAGRRQAWGYRDGASILDGEPMARVSGAAYRLRAPNPPVAVLTGPMTMSSGEAVIVAFRGRPDTRSFGGGTGGKSTANSTFRLADGATLAITTATFADRTGRVYGGPIEPDVPAAAERTPGPSPLDAVVAAATAWLESQPACVRRDGPAPHNDPRAAERSRGAIALARRIR